LAPFSNQVGHSLAYASGGIEWVVSGGGGGSGDNGGAGGGGDGSAGSGYQRLRCCRPCAGACLRQGHGNSSLRENGRDAGNAAAGDGILTLR